MIDFGALLDAPTYLILGAGAVLTPRGGKDLPITVLTQVIEVDETAPSGVVTPTLRTVATLKLADLAAGGLAREDLEKAAIVFGGVRYEVLATAPASSLRELRLILIEVP